MLGRSVFSLILACLCLFSTVARAQCVPNPVAGEPPICQSLTSPPVETGVLTRGGNLVLPGGSGQAGGGPGIDALSGRIGVPVSASMGLSDSFELGTGFTMFLTPAPWDTRFDSWLGQMFVSNLGIYGRYSVIPKKLALSGRVSFLGSLTGRPVFAPMLLQVEAPYTTELASGVRLYWVNNLSMIASGGVQAQLGTSATFMVSITELFYAQALLGSGVGVGGGGVVLPFVDQPVQFGAGGGMVTGENQGIGLAVTSAVAQPVQIEGAGSTSALTNLGIVVTFVKAI